MAFCYDQHVFTLKIVFELAERPKITAEKFPSFGTPIETLLMWPSLHYILFTI